MNQRHRVGLDRIKHAGAARHAAGVPVLQLPSGDEHEREVCIRPLIGRDDVSGHEARAAAFAREVVHKHHALARVALGLARVGDGMLTFKPLPGNARDVGHGAAHFVKHFAGMRVVPIQAELFGHFLNDPQVLPRITRRWNSLAAHLHQPVGVGKAAVLFGKGACREDHIRQIRRFGQEDVLHDQVIQRRQRVAGVVGIRVAHRRVLAHDVQALDLAFVDGVHHLDHGQARRVIQRARRQLPGRFKPRAHRRQGDVLVVRQHHRNQTRIGRTLYIILAPQRVQAGAGAANLPGHERQRNQTASVVGAVYMLAHTHAPKDDRCLGSCVQARDIANRIGINAANRRHQLGAVSGDIGLQRRVVFSAVRDELGIHQVFSHDDMHHRVEQGDIGVGFELQMAMRQAGQVALARIHHDQFRAVVDGVFNPAGCHRVVHRRVRADDDRHFGFRHVHHRVGHRPRANAFQQRHDGRRMAQPRAVIHVVAAKAGAHQLLEQIGFLVAALGRAKSSQRFFAKGVAQLFESATRQRQRFVPRRFTEHVHHVIRIHHGVPAFGSIFAANKRLGKALRMVRVIETVAAFDAQAPVVGRAVAALNEQDFVVFDVVSELAADAAVGAHGVDLFVRYGQRRVTRGHQRSGGACLHTFAARHAGGACKRIVHVEHDLGGIAPECQTDHIVYLLVAAGAQAARALDAGIQIHGDGGMT